MTPQNELIERLRTLLSDHPTTREVQMFGGRSFMIRDSLLVAAQKDGGLLVRVPSEQHDGLLEHPGAAQAEMGTGRTMGPGWVSVSREAITSEEGLKFWLEVALDYNRTLSGG